MKTRTIALTLTLTALLSGTASAEAPRDDRPPTERSSPAGKARPPAEPGPSAPPSQVAPIGTQRVESLRVFATLQVASGGKHEPGQRTTFRAFLMLKGAPLAGRAVSMSLEGKSGSSVVPNGPIQLGTATTDANGMAAVGFEVPELDAATYAIKATFSGDGATYAAIGESLLTIVKSATVIELKRGTSGSGSHYAPHGVAVSSKPYVSIALRRVHDKSGLAKPMTASINGRAYALGGPLATYYTLDLPVQEKEWKVRVTYAGDGSTLPASAELVTK